MSLLDETAFIERQQFFDGEQLFASDLQGLEQLDRELRWLHNKSLHQPGIGSGYAVYGKKGDREVRVGPGYAVDAPGHEIILTRDETLAIPPVSGEPDGQPAVYDLVVSYPDDAALEEVETREGVCVDRGVVRRREAPVFCWARLRASAKGLVVERPKLKADIQAGLRLTIARIQVVNCQLYQDIIVTTRRQARPPHEPRILCGRIEHPDWQSVTLDLSALGETNVGAGLITVPVDTSAAGFSVTPHYWARLQGPQPLLKDGEPILLAVSTYLQQPARTGFVLSVFVLGESIDLDSARAEWGIVWMGVED